MQRAGGLDISPEECIETAEVRGGDGATKQRRAGRAALQGHALLRSEVAQRGGEAVQAPARASVAGTGPRGRLKETPRPGSRRVPRREGRLPGDEPADRRGRSRADRTVKARGSLRGR